MKIIIPMSGKGNRFMKSGYSIPKPLLRIDGRPIIEYVVKMFPGERDITFICNKEHIEGTNMREVLKGIHPEAKIKVISSHGKGPVFAVAQIFDDISDDEPVFISYCDYSQHWDYEGFKRDIARLNPDGAIPSYTGFHPHLLRKNLYAGILTDKDAMMTHIQEKHRFTEDPEDSFHSGGSYYFRSGALVKKYFKELMDKDINLNGEYYVSMVYYLMKRDGLKVFIPKIEHFMQWGTPEDLEEYEAWSRLIHADSGKGKAVTDIPAARDHMVKIPYDAKSEAYKKSYRYWKSYFKKIWSI